MRLVGDIKDEKEAYLFYAFLMRQEIDCTYERFPEGHHIWIYNEDDLETAQELLQRFRDTPNDPIFTEIEVPAFPEAVHEPKQEKWVIKSKMRKRIPNSLTWFFIILCAVLYFWNGQQAISILKNQGKLALQIGMTPLQRTLIFDYPPVNEEIANLLGKYKLDKTEDMPASVKQELAQLETKPTWSGFLTLMLTGKPKLDQVTLFDDIRKGEVWRLFTPTLLHAGLLHILFNMAWLFVLGKQIEQRISRFKMVLMILIIGIIANVAQYLMSGPFFMGFSGVVVGMAGFIWMRQRLAPWEGYPLQRGTELFILFFVLAMMGLEIVTVLLHLFNVAQLTGMIANTAHIVGGLIGLLLGRLSFFARRTT